MDTLQFFKILAALNSAVTKLGTLSAAKVPTAVNTIALNSIGNTAQKVVANATPCSKIVVTAGASNTGAIGIGAASITIANSILLFPTDSLTLELDDLSKLYIIAEVAGEDATITYFS